MIAAITELFFADEVQTVTDGYGDGLLNPSIKIAPAYTTRMGIWG